MRNAYCGEQILSCRAGNHGKCERNRSGTRIGGRNARCRRSDAPILALYASLAEAADPPTACWARQRAGPETSLNLGYVLGLEALRSLFDLELHKLAFVQ